MLLKNIPTVSIKQSSYMLDTRQSLQ